MFKKETSKLGPVHYRRFGGSVAMQVAPVWNHNYHAFIISVHTESTASHRSCTYNIERRYSEFRRLHEKLKAYAPKVPFPGKKIGQQLFGQQLDKKALNARAKALGTFLQAVVHAKYPEKYANYRNAFLAFEQHRLPHAIPAAPPPTPEQSIHKVASNSSAISRSPASSGELMLPGDRIPSFRISESNKPEFHPASPLYPRSRSTSIISNKDGTGTSAAGPLPVTPTALGTRNEGFRCDFCGKLLLAMNTMHTEVCFLGSSSSGENSKEEKRTGSTSPPCTSSEVSSSGEQRMSERHEGVRLCGECSVGHCPECGTQMVPHLPMDMAAEAGVGAVGAGDLALDSQSQSQAQAQSSQSSSRSSTRRRLAPGETGQTVIWYAQYGQTDLISCCQDCDYETTVTVAGKPTPPPVDLAGCLPPEDPAGAKCGSKASSNSTDSMSSFAQQHMREHMRSGS